MGANSSRNDPFEEKFGHYIHRSDKALCPYLKVRLFGPYHGDCHVFLTELKRRLKDHGFKGVKICTDGILNEDGNWEAHPEAHNINEPPESYEEPEETFWWEKSRAFLQGADVCIFLFLDSVLSRPSLPSEAWEISRKEPSNRDDTPLEMNSSVIVELIYWLRNHEEAPDRTLVLFEESMYGTLGSLVKGVVKFEDVYFERIEDGDIDHGVDEAHSKCNEWVMNTCRRELRERRALDPEAFKLDMFDEEGDSCDDEEDDEEGDSCDDDDKSQK